MAVRATAQAAGIVFVLVSVVAAQGTAAAAPLNTGIARAMRNTISDTNDLFDLAFQETYDKIIEEHRSFISYTDRLIFRRNEILDKLLMLDDARQGEATAWQMLLEEDEGLQKAMGGAAAMVNASIDRDDF